ncbi:MAG: hypothetical protein Q9170_000652 [Blastenia crenularia]
MLDMISIKSDRQSRPHQGLRDASGNEAGGQMGHIGTMGHKFQHHILMALETNQCKQDDLFREAEAKLHDAVNRVFNNLDTVDEITDESQKADPAPGSLSHEQVQQIEEYYLHSWEESRPHFEQQFRIWIEGIWWPAMTEKYEEAFIMEEVNNFGAPLLNAAIMLFLGAKWIPATDYEEMPLVVDVVSYCRARLLVKIREEYRTPGHTTGEALAEEVAESLVKVLGGSLPLNDAHEWKKKFVTNLREVF